MLTEDVFTHASIEQASSHRATIEAEHRACIEPASSLHRATASSQHRAFSIEHRGQGSGGAVRGYTAACCDGKRRRAPASAGERRRAPVRTGGVGEWKTIGQCVLPSLKHPPSAASRVPILISVIDCAAMERDDCTPIDTREADPPAGGAGWPSLCSNIGTPSALERAGAHFDGAAPWTACVRSVSAHEKRLCYDGARRLHPIDTREAVPPAGDAG